MHGSTPRRFGMFRRRHLVLDGAGMECSDRLRKEGSRSFRRRACETLAADLDPASVLAFALQRNFHIPVPLQARKLFSPLDQQNAIF